MYVFPSKISTYFLNNLTCLDTNVVVFFVYETIRDDIVILTGSDSFQYTMFLLYLGVKNLLNSAKKLTININTKIKVIEANVYVSFIATLLCNE